MNDDSKAKFTATVYIRGDKAYLPTLGDSGVMLREIAPVFVVAAKAEEIARTLETLRQTGYPKIRQPTLYEIDLPDGYPLLKAAKVGSWKKLAQVAASYSVSWSPAGITLHVSKLDKKGRFVWDHPAKTQQYSVDTDLRIITQAILDDAKSRPELQGKEPRGIRAI